MTTYQRYVSLAFIIPTTVYKCETNMFHPRKKLCQKFTFLKAYYKDITTHHQWYHNNLIFCSFGQKENKNKQKNSKVHTMDVTVLSSCSFSVMLHFFKVLWVPSTNIHNSTQKTATHLQPPKDYSSLPLNCSKENNKKQQKQHKILWTI